jgi:hypothetical protein
MVHTANPSYPGGIGRRITVEANLGTSTRPSLKNKARGHDSSGRMLVQQVQDLEFKPQYHKKIYMYIIYFLYNFI